MQQDKIIQFEQFEQLVNGLINLFGCDQSMTEYDTWFLYFYKNYKDIFRNNNHDKNSVYWTAKGLCFERGYFQQDMYLQSDEFFEFSDDEPQLPPQLSPQHSPSQLITNCNFGETCWKKNCIFTHPPKQIKDCQFGSTCWKKNCIFTHPPEQIKDCRFGVRCFKKTNGCPFNH